MKSKRYLRCLSSLVSKNLIVFIGGGPFCSPGHVREIYVEIYIAEKIRGVTRSLCRRQ